MLISDKIYTFLTVLFSILIVIGNLIYQKFVSINLLGFHNFELSVGAILYPLTFLITDLITEFFGKEKARTCVRLAIIMNIIAALILNLMDAIPATSWSKIDDTTFHKIFGFYNVAFIGSIVACFISQNVDVTLYSWIKKVTANKYLWLRSNGSTCVSLFIDTCVVIGFMSLFGIFPHEQIWVLILSSYSFKLFFTLCSTPLFYLCVWVIRGLIRS